MREPDEGYDWMLYAFMGACFLGMALAWLCIHYEIH